MSKIRLIALVSLVLVALVLSACASGPELGTEENPIVMSLVPSADADEIIASGQAIADVLSEKTGYVIEAVVPTTFVGSIEAMCDGEAHIGTLNTFSYVVAKERGCADVALASVRLAQQHILARSSPVRTPALRQSLTLLASHSAARMSSQPLVGSSPALPWQPTA